MCVQQFLLNCTTALCRLVPMLTPFFPLKLNKTVMIGEWSIHLSRIICCSEDSICLTVNTVSDTALPSTSCPPFSVRSWDILCAVRASKQNHEKWSHYKSFVFTLANDICRSRLKITQKYFNELAKTCMKYRQKVENTLAIAN